MTDRYRLIYWPMLPGRGEYPRLILEDTETPYEDVARNPASAGGGVPRVLSTLSEPEGVPPFAPPVLAVGDVRIAQSANICLFLARRLGRVGDSEVAQAIANQLQLTVADLVAEVHDTHHPLATSQYYEDQREAARAKSEGFRLTRLPKFLGYFERVVARHGGAWLCPEGFTYVDLSFAHTWHGLAYAFPQAMSALSPQLPRSSAIVARVLARPPIAAYRASDRWLPFNEDGIFRRYPELDGPAGALPDA